MSRGAARRNLGDVDPLFICIGTLLLLRFYRA